MMGEGKLNTAILGLDEGGRLLLDAVTRIESFHLHAVADKDTNLAEKVAAEYGCEFFDDYRQLIIQNQLDCLLVAEAIHSCDEYIRAGMKKKFNVLKLAPAARNFEEAAELVALAEEEKVKFTVATTGRFAKSFVKLNQLLQNGKIEQAAESGEQGAGTLESFLLTAFCQVGDYPHHNWQTDPKLAGGGVLLHNCYQLVDQIVLNFGLPQQVYSLNTNRAHDKQQRLYLCEDTSVVTMKFSDVFVGNLIASRREGLGPDQEYLKIYCKDRVITATAKELTVSDGRGEVIEWTEYDDSRLDCMVELLSNFAMSIISPDNNPIFSSGRDNLRDMAVMESAYLSGRTGFPEEPGRILQMAAGGVG